MRWRGCRDRRSSLVAAERGGRQAGRAGCVRDPMGRHGRTPNGEPRCRVKPSSRECQTARVSRLGLLGALMVATTVAGVSLPHVVAGEVAGSLPSLVVGILVGLGCLRFAL